MDVKLYPHQQKFVEQAPNKYGMFFGTGTGKTLTALTIAQKRAQDVLIICPKGIRTKWKKDSEVITIEHKIMTKEEFRRDHKTLRRYDAIIIDEGHHFSSIKSQLHKGLLWYIKKCGPRFIWLCTATPHRREPMNIYALARILGHDWNYAKFRSAFYYEQWFGPRPIWLPKKDKKTQERLISLIHKIGDVIPYESVAEMPPVNHMVEYVEQTTEQKRAMKELEQTEANPLTFYLREHQIMSMKGNKDERLLELSEESSKLAIFARYTEQIDHYKTLFPDALVIDGRTKDKSLVAQEMESRESGVILIQSDSAEGFELPSINTVVFASMSYSYLAYVQSLGRFIRINKENKPKRFFYLLTKNTIDESVHKNIMKKQDFDLKLYSIQYDKTRSKTAN